MSGSETSVLENGVADDLSAAAPALRAIQVLAVTMAVTHMTQLVIYWLPGGQFKTLHLGLALLIVFLLQASKNIVKRRLMRAAVAIVACIAGMMAVVYTFIQYSELVSSRSLYPSPFDFYIGLCLVAATFIAVWLQWGVTIPIMCALGLLYGYFGYLLPGEILYHSGISVGRLVAYASIPNFQGVLGSLTALSASTIFAFLVFAGLLRAFGGFDFIMAISAAIGGRWRSAPGQLSVYSSAFTGMISGSTVANVASTGAITIPMMIRSGYRPHVAGAIEAVASTGGQFTPPVLGLTAFIIAGTTGVPYAEIVLAVMLPAIVYYAYLSIVVHQFALKDRIEARKPEPGGRSLFPLFARYAHILVGIGVLVYFLMIQMPAGLAALLGTATLAITECIRLVLTRWRQPGQALGTFARTLVLGLVEGAISGAIIAVVVAVIGIFIDILVVTGFAQKLSYFMLSLADGQLWLMLAICAISSLVFGIGMPTPAAYILVALFGAPALVKVGVPLLAAHMFVFFFANLSSVTPPVAMAALVGSGIAKSNYWKTAFTAVLLALPAYILPFYFAIHPEILQIGGNWLMGVVYAGESLVAAVGTCVMVFGFFWRRVGVLERLALGVLSAATLFLPAPYSQIAVLLVVTDLAGLGFLHARRTSELPVGDGSMINRP